MCMRFEATAEQLKAPALNRLTYSIVCLRTSRLRSRTRALAAPSPPSPSLYYRRRERRGRIYTREAREATRRSSKRGEQLVYSNTWQRRRIGGSTGSLYFFLPRRPAGKEEKLESRTRERSFATVSRCVRAIAQGRGWEVNSLEFIDYSLASPMHLIE